MNQNATKVLVVVSVNGEVLRQFSMSAHAESAKSEISACATDAVFTYNNYAVAKFHYLATTALGDVFAEGDVDIGADVAREQEKDGLYMSDDE